MLLPKNKSNPDWPVTPSGGRVKNTTDGSSCEIKNVNATTLACDAGLANGSDNTWQQNDAYEIGGSGVLKLSANFNLATTSDDETFAIDSFPNTLEASLNELTVDDPPCMGDACAKLSIALQVGNTTKVYY